MGTAATTMQRMWLTTSRAYPWSFTIGSVVSGTLTMVIAYVAFHSLSEGRVSAAFETAAGSGDYLAYVALGTICYEFYVRLMLWTSRALITEERQGTILSLLSTPMRPASYLAGNAGFGLVATALEAAALLVVALVLGLRFHPVSPLAVIGGVALFAVATLSVASLVGVVMLLVNDTYITQNTTFLVTGLFCGFVFPPELLPGGWNPVTGLVPLTGGLQVLRECLGLTSDPITAGTVVTTVLTSMVFMALTAFLMPRALSRVVERGM